MRPQKRKHKKVLGDHDDDEAESSSSPRAAKRSRGSMFTNSHETFIAERLADREFCLLWSRPSCKSRFEAQSSFCDKFTLDFNHKFDTDIGSTQMRNKINYMIRQWKEAYILKCSPVNSDHQSRSKLDSRIKSFCHYFDLMEPTWATCSAIAETEKCPEVQETDNDDDDDKSDVDNDDNDGDGEDDGDGDDDDDDDTDTDGDQSRNEHERETESTGDNEEDRDKAIVAPSKPDDNGDGAFVAFVAC
ncbi:hypothetical protein B0O80DRAFT_425629 [Mortierella sp. GBAus27b]|nr:hypothetical protein B0O80DRAFT_425629 [Mortierella sp. GBAus27b]